jgi:hypothetical protein
VNKVKKGWHQKVHSRRSTKGKHFVAGSEGSKLDTLSLELKDMSRDELLALYTSFRRMEIQYPSKYYSDRVKIIRNEMVHRKW